MLIFVSEKNRPLLLAKGVCQCNEYKYDLEIISMNATHFNIHHLHTHTHTSILWKLSSLWFQDDWSNQNEMMYTTRQLNYKTLGWPHMSVNVYHFTDHSRVCFTVCSGYQERKYQSSALWGESTSDQSIPLTNDQYYIKCLHVNMSSWFRCQCDETDIKKKHSHLLSIYLFIYYRHDNIAKPFLWGQIWYHNKYFLFLEICISRLDCPCG